MLLELKFDGDTVADFKLAPGAVIHCVVRNEKRGAAASAAANNSAPYIAPSLSSTDPELAPGAILNSPAYFDRIFALLDLPQSTSETVFVLLSKLPPNPMLLSRLEKLEGLQVDWAALVKKKNFFNFLVF